MGYILNISINGRSRKRASLSKKNIQENSGRTKENPDAATSSWMSVGNDEDNNYKIRWAFGL